MTVNERAGDNGDGWETAVELPGDVRQVIREVKENRRAADLERREGEHVEKLLEALRQFPEGETMRKLAGRARLNDKDADRAMAVLQKQGRVEAFEKTKANVLRDHYKLQELN